MKQNKTKKIPVFTDDTDIRLGFEIECIIGKAQKTQRNEGNTWWGADRNRDIATRIVKWALFKEEIQSIREKFKLSRPVTVGYDGSINLIGFSLNNSKSSEIRTPPLKPKTSMKVLEEVFRIVNKYGGTNKSCGFHVNISSSYKENMRKFDPIVFMNSTIWSEILRKFKRTASTFCKKNRIWEQRKSSKVTFFRELASAFTDKYRCVNLSNFEDGLSRTSRVEIRGFGNADYTKRYDDIAEYIHRIEKLFKKSYKETPVNLIETILPKKAKKISEEKELATIS